MTLLSVDNTVSASAAPLVDLAPVSAGPLLDRGTRPDAAGSKHHLRCWKVAVRRHDRMDALPAHAEHLGYLGDADEVVHSHTLRLEQHRYGTERVGQ